MFRYKYLTLAVLALAFTFTAHLAAAQEEEENLGWSKIAEVSLVSTSGNSETETLGLNAAFVKTMPTATLALHANGLRAESTSTSRSAIGTSPSDVVITETSTTSLNAENYSFGGRFDREINDSLFWFTGLKWEKNEFAGFSERLTGVAGAGNTWWKDDDSHFRTDYGLTYTRQDDLVPSPGREDAFLGARLGYDYGRALTSTSRFGSTLVVDQNLDENADRRADFVNWVSVSISDRLALKVSLQALYDNLPAVGSLPIVTADGVPTGERVLFVFDDTDTVFTTALVITF